MRYSILLNSLLFLLFCSSQTSCLIAQEVQKDIGKEELIPPVELIIEQVESMVVKSPKEVTIDSLLDMGAEISSQQEIEIYHEQKNTATLSLMLPSNEMLSNAEYVERLKVSIMALRENHHTINGLIISAILNKKNLEKKETELNKYVELLKDSTHLIQINGNDETIVFSNKNGGWFIELLKLVNLKEAIIEGGLIEGNRISIEIENSKKIAKESQSIDIKINAKINESYIRYVMDKNRHVNYLSARLDTLFDSAQFNTIDNVKADYYTENYLKFSFSNYETNYNGTEDIDNYIKKIKPIIEEYNQIDSISRVVIEMNSYDSKEFFELPSEIEYQAEYGKELPLKYSLKPNNSKISTKIKEGNITILEQELLKLHEINQQLDLKTVVDYHLNYDSGKDDLETNIIIYFDSKF